MTPLLEAEIATLVRDTGEALSIALGFQSFLKSHTCGLKKCKDYY
jgi:hypothetical protein